MEKEKMAGSKAPEEKGLHSGDALLGDGGTKFNSLGLTAPSSNLLLFCGTSTEPRPSCDADCAAL